MNCNMKNSSRVQQTVSSFIFESIVKLRQKETHEYFLTDLYLGQT